MKQVLLCFLLLISIPAMANAGSPLIWFNMFHLVFANAVIGLIESSFLNKRQLDNRTWVVIIANYISMAVGYYLILPAIATTRYGRDLWTSDNFLAGIFISFLATLVIEYPLFVVALYDRKDWIKLYWPFFKANLITNCAMLFIYILFM